MECVKEKQGLWKFVLTMLLSFKQLQYQEGSGEMQGEFQLSYLKKIKKV